MPKVVSFKDKDGSVLLGKIMHIYPAFEGGVRYIIEVPTGREYRCICEDGKFKEYVP